MSGKNTELWCSGCEPNRGPGIPIQGSSCGRPKSERREETEGRLGTLRANMFYDPEAAVAERPVCGAVMMRPLSHFDAIEHAVEQPTLRDRFAMRALAGSLASTAGGDGLVPWIDKETALLHATEAYVLADAMMVVRDRPTPAQLGALLDPMIVELSDQDGAVVAVTEAEWPVIAHTRDEEGRSSISVRRHTSGDGRLLVHAERGERLSLVRAEGTARVAAFIADGPGETKALIRRCAIRIGEDEVLARECIESLEKWAVRP